MGRSAAVGRKSYRAVPVALSAGLAMSVVGVVGLAAAGRAVASQQVFQRSTAITPPSNAGPNSARSSGISCASPGNCTAMGGYYVGMSAQPVPMAADEIDGTWTQAVEIPVGGTLDAVSCPTARNCEAAGAETGPDFCCNPTTIGPAIVVGETNGTWGQPQTVTLPPDADSNPRPSLRGISCQAIGTCVAVGQYDVGGSSTSVGYTQGMVVTESNGAWGQAMRSPLPGDAPSLTNDWLSGVSCVDSGDCTAVGSYYTNNTLKSFVVVETNGVWGQATAIGPSGSTLKALSCVSVGNCTAAGDNGYVVPETNGTWGNPVAISPPQGAQTTTNWGWTGISCTTVDCVTIGRYAPDSSKGQTGAAVATGSGEGWSGADDAASTGSAPINYDIWMAGISCPAADTCQATGSDFSHVSGGSSGALVLTALRGPSSPYICAFQSYDGTLWTVGTGGWKDWNVGVAQQTSPSVTRLPNGYEVAFHSYQGSLWTVGTAGWTDWNAGLAPGTSPAIAALATGGFQVAFQGYDGSLWTVGNGGWTDWGVGMAPGTSPSITALPTGGFETAFQSYSGQLWTVGNGGWMNWGLSMANKASPAITPDKTFGSIEAFDAADGTLWTVGNHGSSWQLGLAPRTSPAEA